MGDRAWRSDGRWLATVSVPIVDRDGSEVTGLAKCGWLVEVHLIPERESNPRFLAVGTPEAGEAEEAILRYPGIVREDKRTARRRLSDQEIACLRLRADGVRPYILDLRRV